MICRQGSQQAFLKRKVEGRIMAGYFEAEHGFAVQVFIFHKNSQITPGL